jgi:hypothetical protein
LSECCCQFSWSTLWPLLYLVFAAWIHFDGFGIRHRIHLWCGNVVNFLHFILHSALCSLLGDTGWRLFHGSQRRTYFARHWVWTFLQSHYRHFVWLFQTTDVGAVHNFSNQSWITNWSSGGRKVRLSPLCCVNFNQVCANFCRIYLILCVGPQWNCMSGTIVRCSLEMVPAELSNFLVWLTVPRSYLDQMYHRLRNGQVWELSPTQFNFANGELNLPVNFSQMQAPVTFGFWIQATFGTKWYFDYFVHFGS